MPISLTIRHHRFQFFFIRAFMSNTGVVPISELHRMQRVFGNHFGELGIATTAETSGWVHPPTDVGESGSDYYQIVVELPGVDKASESSLSYIAMCCLTTGLFRATSPSRWTRAR